MLATVMNGSCQSWEELADGLTETVGAPSLREKRRVVSRGRSGTLRSRHHCARRGEWDVGGGR